MRTRRDHSCSLLAAALVVLLGACGGTGAPGAPGDAAGAGRGAGEAEPGLTVFTGATILDGVSELPIEDGVLVVGGGRVVGVGSRATMGIPADARRVDLADRVVVPGIINAHGHVGSARGLRTGPEVYTRENLLEQLELNARYGVTTVVSLGGDGPEGVRVRDEQDRPDLERSRLFVAGPVLDPSTPAAAAEQVAEVAEMGVDWVKFRVDDFLGRGRKMAPEVYRAIIEEAHRRELPVAVHIVELEDAVALVEAGADLIAHSVRDVPVGDDLIRLMRERDVCLVPTLAREVSTYVYQDRPEFFDDPFFTREVDPGVVETLQEPARQARMAESESARWYREHLSVAQENLARMHRGGVTVALGTDSGPAARFQGYFEHMEMELMADAGLSSTDILRAATRDAARCMGLSDDLGTLERGKWADFVVLRENPLEDIRNFRSIDGVWIAGNRVPGSRWGPEAVGR